MVKIFEWQVNCEVKSINYVGSNYEVYRHLIIILHRHIDTKKRLIEDVDGYVGTIWPVCFEFFLNSP